MHNVPLFKREIALSLKYDRGKEDIIMSKGHLFDVKLSFPYRHKFTCYVMFCPAGQVALIQSARENKTCPQILAL